MRIATRGALCSLLMISLPACQTPQSFQSDMNSQDIGSSDNYKQIVEKFVKRSYFDPYSVRDAAIGYPFFGSMPGQSLAGRGWMICFEMNAKNRYGAYTGIKQHVVLFRKSEVIASEIEDFIADEICKNQKMQPWKPKI